MFNPGQGLVITSFVLLLATAAVFGPLAMSTVLMASATLLAAAMLAVAAFLPPSKPFREVSELTARIADLVKVASGASLFGAAAIYGGIVSAMIDRLPTHEQLSLTVAWGVTWPIIAVATALGSSVIGVRLGWTFRSSQHRDRLLAIAKFRNTLLTARTKRYAVAGWLTHVVVVASRSGTFMFIGYLLPAIVAGDVWLIQEFAQPHP